MNVRSLVASLAVASVVLMHPVVDHPEIGEFEYEGYPVKLSRTPAFVRGRGPLLREHNRYVYGELLGLSDEEMKSLENEKVI